MDRSFACFDFDRTIYDGFALNDLAEVLVAQKVLSKTFVDAVETLFQAWSSGAMAYEDVVSEFLQLWCNGLHGQAMHEVLDITRTFFADEAAKLYPYIHSVRRLLQPTHDCFIITSSPQFIAQAACEALDFDGYGSTEFAHEDGTFNGVLHTTLAHRESKRTLVEELFQRYSERDSIAFGDSEGDIGMLQQTEHAVCINATAGLEREAHARGWHVVQPHEVESIVRHLIRLD